MWRIVKFMKFLIIGALAIGVFSAGAMYLWNALIPELFHGPVLNYWQTIGLLVLSHIFFRGGHFGGGHRWRHEAWKRKMQSRMEGMSPEEKEKFLSELGGHGCCHGHKHREKEAV